MVLNAGFISLQHFVISFILIAGWNMTWACFIMRFTQGLEMIWAEKHHAQARNESVLDNAVAIISFIERDPGTDVSNTIRCYSTPSQFVEPCLQKNVSWNILLNGLKVKWWEVGLEGKVKDQIRNTRDRIIVCKYEVEDWVGWHELWRLIKHSWVRSSVSFLSLFM